MIDIKKARDAFTNYVNTYDMNNKKIDLKYYHTLRVADLCRKIAISLELNDEEVHLAELVGLLHDIARFEQVKIYDSFNDLKTVDHGDLGATLLFDNDLIRDFIETNEYDEIIKKAVYIHNKPFIPDDYTEEEKLYSRIVRDADKIDILYLCSINVITYNITNEEISREVIEGLLNRELINKRIVKTGLDKVILNLAFVYDLNFSYSYEILRKENYLGITIDSLDLKEEESRRVFNNLKDFINNDFDIIKEVA